MSLNHFFHRFFHSFSPKRSLKRIDAYIIAIIATVLWGTVFAFSKKITPVPLSPIVYTGMCSMMGTVFLFLFLLISRQLKVWWRVFKKYSNKFLLISIGFYVIASIVQFWALGHTTAINQSIFSNTQALWVVIFNMFFFKHRPTRKFVAGMILAITGVLIILVNKDFSISSATIIGDIFSLVSYILWGGYIAFLDPICKKENPIIVTFSVLLIGGILLTPLMFINGAIYDVSMLSSSQWSILLYLGIFCVGITYLLWSWALSCKEIPSENIGLTSLLIPVVGIFTSIIFLGEILTLRTIIGTIVILGALFIAEYDFTQKNTKKSKKILR
ncbi:MAG: DMT family transporter [Promethearchaeota archaeon]